MYQLHIHNMPAEQTHARIIHMLRLADQTYLWLATANRTA